MPTYPEQLLAVIAAPDAASKAALLAMMDVPSAAWSSPPLPGRPGRPPHYHEASEAPPRRRRTLAHAPTRNRFLLAIHHIELSAVDLAVAACLRAVDQPPEFHRDFLSIARDEARHAGLIADLLIARSLPPGCEPVHHRLWDAALACADLGEHLVVVPRFLEARGLDVSAGLLPRLAELDPEAHRVITIIYQDEIGHVAIGSTWHQAWCRQHGLNPVGHFQAVAARHFPGQIPGPTPLDRQGRTAAGFLPEELDWLENSGG